MLMQFTVYFCKNLFYIDHLFITSCRPLKFKKVKISPYFSGMNKQKGKKAKIFNKSVSDILVTQNMRHSKDKENLLKLFLP